MEYTELSPQNHNNRVYRIIAKEPHLQSIQDYRHTVMTPEYMNYYHRTTAVQYADYVELSLHSSGCTVYKISGTVPWQQKVY